MRIDAHYIYNNEVISRRTVLHVPRPGDEIRIAEGQLYVVSRIVWCYDEDTPRVNIGLGTLAMDGFDPRQCPLAQHRDKRFELRGPIVEAQRAYVRLRDAIEQIPGLTGDALARIDQLCKATSTMDVAGNALHRHMNASVKPSVSLVTQARECFIITVALADLEGRLSRGLANSRLTSEAMALWQSRNVHESYVSELLARFSSINNATAATQTGETK
jgi:hypothetical protein